MSWIVPLAALLNSACASEKAQFASGSMSPSMDADAGFGGAAASGSADGPAPSMGSSSASTLTGVPPLADSQIVPGSVMSNTPTSAGGATNIMPGGGDIIGSAAVEAGQEPPQPFCGDGVQDPTEVCDEGEANSNTEPNACREDCILPSCGDGVIDDTETCDEAADNNDTAANACRTDCLKARCGDGILDAAEACDDGPQNSDSDPERCSTQCKLAGCGDGLLGMGETCDNGSSNNDETPDACRTTCQEHSCGDGVTDSDEDCDEGSNNSNTQADACRADCSNHGCGDGVIDGDEDCDGGEDCNAECKAIVCGDGDIEGTEVCDEGPANSDTGECTTQCQTKRCGDGKLQPGEECDDGMLMGQYGGCKTGCEKAPFCGDGNVDQGNETCDDGSDNSGGYGKCKSDCELDVRCGDGVVQSANGEECDGGNGCSSECETLAAAEVVAFSVADEVVAPGGSQTTLSWEVRSAQSLKIDPGVGTVTGTSVSVTVTKTTTYTLTAIGAGGNDTATVTVSVTATGEQDSLKVHFGDDDAENVTGVTATGDGIFVLDTNYGTADSTLRQIKDNGSAGWVREISSAGSDYARGVAAAPNGDLVVAGTTNGELDSNREPNDSDEGFIARYSPSNQQRWVHTFGTTDSETANGVATDNDGDAYVCGETYGDIKGTNAGGSDAYVVKYNADGSASWTAQFGTTESEYANAIAVDGNGNVFVVGATMGSLQSGVTNAGAYDAYVTKLDSSGKVSWSKMLGTSGAEYAHGVAVDGSGNVFVAGKTEGKIGSIDDPDYDAFLVKYSGSGDVLWKEQIGTGAFDGAWAVDTDSEGNAYLVGLTNGRIDPDYASAAPVDAFIAKYASDRELQWIRQFGAAGGDEATAVAVDPSSRIVVAGTTQGNLFGTLVGTSDGFVVRYR